MTGQNISHYPILKKLGAGGMQLGVPKFLTLTTAQEATVSPFMVVHCASSLTLESGYEPVSADRIWVKRHVQSEARPAKLHTLGW
jgi:hypothetical protein